jgi:hypothetical protein
MPSETSHLHEDTLAESHPISAANLHKLRKVKIASVDNISKDLVLTFWMKFPEFITSIMNSSLNPGIVPTCFKGAILIPLLKSSTMDPEVLKSYRPVSNLPFLSKILETIVASQLLPQLEKNLGCHQSAYRRNYGVETALCHVSSSILEQLDQGNDVYMVFIDLSAAFDTINHKLILNTLYYNFGIRGVVLRWINSYLSNRYFEVKMGNSVSDSFSLSVGVPQGSILGPILFNCIMAGLARQLEKMEVNHHIYADDTQIWIPFKPGQEETTRDTFKQAAEGMLFGEDPEAVPLD